MLAQKDQRLRQWLELGWGRKASCTVGPDLGFQDWMAVLTVNVTLVRVTEECILT